MMDDLKFGVFLGTLLGLFVALMVCIVVDIAWRREAVEKGHAEYVLQGDEAVWQRKEVKELSDE